MKKWECLKRCHFNGSIVITDPHYINFDGGEDEVEEMIGDRGLSNWTFYGDWGCTVYQKHGCRVGHIPDIACPIGRFCADSGLVCVVSLEDVIARFPGFMEWQGKFSHCATIIRDFEGDVRFMVRRSNIRLDDGQVVTDTELRIHGDGTIDGEKASFESVQTSL